MGLIWGHAKNTTHPWRWDTGRRIEHVQMLSPHPCLLLPQIPWLSVALVTGSARRNSSSAKASGSLPSQPASLGRKSVRGRQISLPASPSRIHGLISQKFFASISPSISVSSMIECRCPASPPPPWSQHTDQLLFE